MKLPTATVGSIATIKSLIRLLRRKQTSGRADQLSKGDQAGSDANDGVGINLSL